MPAIQPPQKSLPDLIVSAAKTGREAEFNISGVDFKLSQFFLEKSLFEGPTFAAIGDSMTDQNSRNIVPPSASPSSAWFSDGYAGWLRILSGQRINFPLENEQGVSGETIAQVYARLDRIIELNPDYCIVLVGPNDVAVSTFEAMRDGWLSIVRKLKGNGVIPITLPMPPRAGSVLTTAQILLQQRFTNFQRQYCARNRGYYFADYLKYFIDQASATGVPLALMVKADNLHPSATGAYYMGKALTELVNTLVPPASSTFSSAVDYYEATNNPTGSLLHSGATNYSTMAGTTGTHTASSGFTTSGNLATGWTSVRSGGATSTCAVTCSKEARTDGWASGALQVVAIDVTVAGGADEIHNLRATPVFADVAAGDWYYAEVKIDVTAAPVNINAIELYLLETRPSNSQTAIDQGYNAATSLLIPQVTWSGILRTPPIQRQADATALQVNLRTRMNTTSGAAGVTYKVTDFIVRKLDPSFI